MTVHRITNASDVRTGNAVAPNRTKLGVPFEGTEAQSIRVISLGAPIAADDDGIAAAQAVAGAGNLTIAGALASGGTVTFDVPRNVQIVSSDTGDTAQTATVTGTDVYGQTTTEVITFNGTTPVLGKKAFNTVTQIAISAVMTGTAKAGSGSKLGLPYRPVKGGFLRGRVGEDTADAGTYVAPERSASTTTTADVRGVYTPAGSLNGTLVYSVAIAVQNGPSDEDAFGIAQF